MPELNSRSPETVERRLRQDRAISWLAVSVGFLLLNFILFTLVLVGEGRYGLIPGLIAAPASLGFILFLVAGLYGLVRYR